MKTQQKATDMANRTIKRMTVTNNVIPVYGLANSVPDKLPPNTQKRQIDFNLKNIYKYYHYRPCEVMGHCQSDQDGNWSMEFFITVPKVK